MTVQDGQESVQKRVGKEQAEDNAENINPALSTEQPRGARIKAPSKCSKYGSFEHNARTCSLYWR